MESLEATKLSRRKQPELKGSVNERGQVEVKREEGDKPTIVIIGAGIFIYMNIVFYGLA